MMHCEILSEEEYFSEFYPDAFSDCLSDVYTGLSEDDSSSEHSSHSGECEYQTNKKTKNLSD